MLLLLLLLLMLMLLFASAAAAAVPLLRLYLCCCPTFAAIVNYAPTFTPGVTPIEVDEDAPAYNATWATAISAGPGDEESVTMSIACDRAADTLFSEAPSISDNGVLIFTPAGDVSGSSNCTVTLSEVGTNAKTATEELVITIKPGAGRLLCGWLHHKHA
jgi:hypothetical protein